MRDLRAKTTDPRARGTRGSRRSWPCARHARAATWTARALLGDDPRIWYDSPEGPGAPWKLGGGRWKTWDEHFRGENELVSDWQRADDRVWVDVLETNDYFRLTEGSPGPWRATYFLESDGRIRGFMVSAVPGAEKDGGRREEFEAWARENRPDEAEYLMPGRSIDPTGDRAPRMRALLEEWRAAVGLPPLDA